jgi:hypothetical protein
MKGARHPLTQKLLALVPVLLLVVSFPGQVLLRCQMDGQLRSACCCPGDEDEASAEAGATLSSPCCDRVIASRQGAPVAPARGPAPAVDVAIPVGLPAIAARDHFAPRTPPRALLQGGPPREGPPLSILKQSFLI